MCFRRSLHSSECPVSQEAPFLQSLEELGTPLGAQQQEQQQGREQQSGQPFHRGQSFCHLSATSSVHPATGMLSKAVSMSGINLLLDCSDPNGNSSQSHATDLNKCGKQLEEDSGTWAGSSLRRTFSFLLGMTGRDKVGVSLGSSRRAATLLILLVHPSPILLLETREGLSL